MAEKEETRFKKRMFKLFDKLPCTWYEKINQVAVRGIPDILMCVNGHFVGIELKRVGGTVDKLQRYKLNGIKKANGISFVLDEDNLQEAYEFLYNLAIGRRKQ